MRTSAVIIFLPILIAEALLLSGCSRRDYRLRADEQSYDIIAEKTRDHRWNLPGFDLRPDPRSRFHDPHDPDHPPLPPDDPAAGRSLDAGEWDRLPRVPRVENPAWPVAFGGAPIESDDAPLPTIESLSLANAVDIGLIHSRDYRAQLEDVYLSALSLTLERYRFDIRTSGFMGEPGSEISVEQQGKETTTLALGPTHAGARTLLPGGAQLVAELANNTLWLLSGSSGTRTASTIAFSIVQPLLAGAGRNVVLEDLTQAERNALYATRDFARFRKSFYVMIVTGSRAIPLPGNTGRGELAFLIRGERSPTVGFYRLLYLYQMMRNGASNVRTLEDRFHDIVRQARDGRASDLEVTQLQSSLETSRGDYLLRRRSYENQLDRFKVQLGLPPDMAITIDDSLLAPFRFRRASLAALEDRVRAFRDRVGTPAGDPAAASVRGTATELRAFHEAVDTGIGEVAAEFRRLEEIIPQRRAGFDSADSRELFEREIAADRGTFAALRKRVAAAGDRIDRIDARLAAKPLPLPARRTAAARIAETAALLANIARKLTGLSSVIRVELITLTPVDLTPAAAVSLALKNRLDLMNRRAFVMDARRRIEIAADRLEAGLDIVAEGAIDTPPLAGNDRPFDFRAARSACRLGLVVTTPLDRRRQRNDFRAAQIAYQRARRNFIAAEDQVKLDVRYNLRRLTMERRFFEISRRALRVAVKELDQAIEQGERINGDRGGENGNGQQGLNIPRALDNLLDAQDELIETWVDYETARLKLARDTGTMQVDAEGVWPAAAQRTWTRGTPME